MIKNSIQSSILIHASLEDLSELFKLNRKIDLEELKKELKKESSDEILSREETLKFLHIDSSTLWAWTKKGKVKAYGIGNRRYYKKAELLQSLIPLKK
jgi:phosphorylcholine metabolism protein LicD